MQDVSRVVGNPVVIHCRSKGKDYRLRGLNFDSLGGLQGQILHDQRKKKLETAAQMAALLPKEDRAELIDKARHEAEEIAYIGLDDLKEFVTTDVGAIYVLWFLFEQDYPGEVTRGDVLTMVASGEIDKEKLDGLLASAFGGGPAGNSIGQNGSAEVSTAAKAAGDTRSGSYSSRRKKAGSGSPRVRPAN